MADEVRRGALSWAGGGAVGAGGRRCLLASPASDAMAASADAKASLPLSAAGVGTSRQPGDSGGAGGTQATAPRRRLDEGSSGEPDAVTASRST